MMPVFLLNKADLCTQEEIETALSQIRHIAPGTALHALSAEKNEGVETLNRYVAKGVTVSLVGNSGVGKSTLINRLTGTDLLKTGAVRAVDSKGRHTTTWREMLVLPRGGVVIDTPGLREMQVWASEEDIENTFEDVEQLARQCRFRNCTHTSEQGCAVLQAIKDRTLDAGRLGNYIRLYEDVRYLESRKKEKSAK